MYRIAKLNKIANIVNDYFPAEQFDLAETDDPHGIIVRSADMHGYDKGQNLLAVARAGAGTNTASMGTLSKGTKLTALGKNNGWYLVKNSNGTQGFVSGSYLTKNKVSSGSSSSSTAATKTVTAKYVNVRADGGMSAPVVTVLAKGTKVEVLKKGNYWTKISYKGTVGWIKNTYLK